MQIIFDKFRANLRPVRLAQFALFACAVLFVLRGNLAVQAAPTQEGEATAFPTATPTAIPVLSNPLLPGTQTVVVSQGQTHFELGGQIDSLNETTLGAVQKSGMSWVQYRIEWEPSATAETYYERIGRAHQAGLKVMVTLVSKPQYASAEYFSRYAAFASDLAKAGVNAIEIWRDMNLSSSWLPGRVDPLDYTILLQISHLAIKASNPNTMIISGAPMPIVENSRCDGTQCDDLPFIKEMARYGAFQFADCMGVKYDEGLISPHDVQGDPRKSVDYYTRYFQGMVSIYSQVSRDQIPLCFTDFGYLSTDQPENLPASYAWAREHQLTESQRAQFLSEAVALSASQSQIRLMFVNNLSARQVALSDGVGALSTDATPTADAIELPASDVPTNRLGGLATPESANPLVSTAISGVELNSEAVRSAYALIGADNTCLACESLGQSMSTIHTQGAPKWLEQSVALSYVQELDQKTQADLAATQVAIRATEAAYATQTEQAKPTATPTEVYIPPTLTSTPNILQLEAVNIPQQPTSVPQNSGVSTAVPAQATPIPVQPTAVPAQPTAVPVSGPVTGFALGGQVQFFAQNAVDAMNRSGMTWVKHQVPWAPGARPEDYSWLIGNAHSRNFRVLLSVKGHPGDTGPEKFGEYARFAAALAGAGADAIEVWNEPNLEREWTKGQISPASYTELLRQAYGAIKAANPNVMVISAAPAPTGFFSSCTADGCNDYEFIQGMVSAGALNYMDCLGAHYNEGLVSPYATSGDPRGSSEHYTRYYQGIVNTYWTLTGGQKPICFTELGFLSGEEWGYLPNGFTWRGLPNAGGINMTVAQHAQYLGEAAQLSKTQGKVRLMIVWNVDFTRFDDDPMAGFAIIRPNGSCPACETLGNAMR
ncbi:MAG TPA: hypothetical protein PK299_13985 [Anaerolineales bacterium]|nr:hypothetical protein [Anaerolineales bacterium]